MSTSILVASLLLRISSTAGILLADLLHRIEYLPRASIEGLVRRDAQGLVGGSIHCCCNGGKGTRPVVQSFVNEVPHHLVERSNPALNLAVRLVVVLGGHPDLNSQGLHHLGPKLRGELRVLVQNNTEWEAMNIKDGSLKFLKGFLRSGGVLEGD